MKTIEKAIEILEKHGVVDEETTWEDYLEAAQMGAFALKGIARIRTTLEPYVTELLQGETEE